MSNPVRFPFHHHARRVSKTLSALVVSCASMGVMSLAATPAGAATTLSAATTLTGSQTLSSTGVTATDLSSGLSASFDLVTTLHWTQPAALLNTNFDSNLVRQGRALDPSVSYVRTVPGSMAITWTLNNLSVSWGSVGPLNLGSPGFSASGSCQLMAAGPDELCSLSSPTIPLLDPGFPAIGPYVDLGLSAAVTVTPQGISTIRQATFGGAAGGTAGLTLGETPVTDALSVPCTVGAGDNLSYQLGALSSDQAVKVNTGLVFDVGAEFPDPIIPFKEDKIQFAAPTVPLATALSDLNMTGPGATFDLGNVQANNIPPAAVAGGPYAGNEGSPVAFDGSASSSICGFPTLQWNFSDGGVAYGPSPQHSFESPGVFSGLLTATDATGLVSLTTFSVNVANLPPVANSGPDMSSEWGDPVTLNGSAYDPGTAEQPFLNYAWNFGDGSPSGSGGASATHTYAAPGTYSVTLTACDPEAACGTSTSHVVVSQRSTVLSYTGSTTSDVTDASSFTTSLVDDHGAPVSGRTVKFFADGSATPFATASTSAAGTATVSYAFGSGSVGPHAIVATFAGDSLYTSSSAASSFSVTKDGTVLKYNGVTSAKPSHALPLTATLTDDAGRALAGRVIHFSIGTQSCDATTNASGVASCTIAKLTAKSGTHVLGVAYAGSGDYLSSNGDVGFKVS